MADTKNNTGVDNTGDYNSGYYNSGYYNSGYYNSGYYNSGDYNSGDYNSGDYNSGDYNSGDYNSGYRNSGIFNTDEPKMRSFNKESEYTYTEFRNKFGWNDIVLPVTARITKDGMTDEEKKEVDGWEQMGGYLKTLSYKDAWKEGWENAKKEQKEWYLSLPNFDPAIFKEITGIDVESKETIKIGNRTYDKTEVERALENIKSIS